MMLSFVDLRGYGIHAVDGDIGSVRDAFFEDTTSTIRYLVVDTGGWLGGRRVLLAPAALGEVDHDAQKISTALTRAQIEDSPGVDTDQPVSRQHEEQLHRYYDWTPYWYGTTAYGLAPYWGAMPPPDVPPSRPEANRVEQELIEAERERADPHLRSAHEVVGYYVAASDGDIGHVEDLLIDPVGWRIEQLVIDTRNWLPGKKVLVSPERLRAVDWADRHIGLDMTRDQVKASPEHDAAMMASA
jgi:sporulation protein YlmC with PRC-barrel domain